MPTFNEGWLLKFGQQWDGSRGLCPGPLGSTQSERARFAETSVQQSIRRGTDDLVHALVVEPHRHASRGQEHGHTISNDQCAGAVHFKALAAVQFDRKTRKGCICRNSVSTKSMLSAVTIDCVGRSVCRRPLTQAGLASSTRASC